MRQSGTTIKRLFARSGNRCAFPRCTVELVQGSTIVGEICHIKAASPNGSRYDPQQPDIERHGYANLILLCPTHHTIIDDDPEAYSAERLAKMKADHEDHSAALSATKIERGTRLLAGEAATAVRQPDEGAGAARARLSRQVVDHQSRVAYALDIHNNRVAKIASAAAPVALLDGGALVMHVIPLSAPNGVATQLFEKVSRNPDRFPTIADNSARDWKIKHDGLLVGSNADGLSKPQRAYVQVFRNGVVESVASSLARGRGRDALMLPQIQAMIIKYACIYARSLAAFGMPPPFAIMASLVGVRTMRLLQDFIGSALTEDIPFASLNDDRVQFDGAVLEAAPSGYNECAKSLRPLLTHLANTADLPSSPYFDAEGNYLLKL